MLAALSLSLSLLAGQPEGDAIDEPAAPEPAPEPATTEPEPAPPESPESPEPEPEPAPAIEAPSVPAPAPSGGFGSVDNVTTNSNVVAPPPPVLPDPDGPPGPEMAALIQAGYAQTDLGNAQHLDHHGLFLRAHFIYYPWVQRRRKVAGGLGAMYGYQGANRWRLPDGVANSTAQQQHVAISADLLMRPHPQWFSILVDGLIGLGFYTNAKVYTGDRPATIAKDEYAFVAGGVLGVCTAWDIVCVLGGSEIFVGVRSQPVNPLGLVREVDPFGWHVALGFDVLRVLARANRTAG